MCCINTTHIHIRQHFYDVAFCNYQSLKLQSLVIKNNFFQVRKFLFSYLIAVENIEKKPSTGSAAVNCEKLMF